MARKRHRGSGSAGPGYRTVRVQVVVRPRVYRPPVSRLSEFEDRRTYYPDRRVRPAKGFFFKPNIVLRKASVPIRRSRVGGVGPALRDGGWNPVFDVPKNVVACERRRERREVLHALNKVRSGRGGSKKRNSLSEVGC